MALSIIPARQIGTPRHEPATAHRGRFSSSCTVHLSASDTRDYAIAMNYFTKLPNNLGMLLLAVWLILFGVLTAPFLKFSFSHSGDLLAVLAIVVGIVLLMKR